MTVYCKLDPIIQSFAKKNRFTPQEHKVLCLRIAGHHGKSIACAIGCSPNTVSTYWKRMFRKAACSDQAEVLASVLRFALTTSGGGIDDSAF